MLIALLASAVSAFGQPSFEVTPLVGGIYGGSIKLRQDGQADRLVKLDNAVTFGVTGGFRFDGDECERCELVEFRWMRQNTYLNLDTSVPPVGPSRPSVTIDHFLAAFTREWPIEETQDRVVPFLGPKFRCG